MSQFWHAHWAEDGFKPTRLGNWQVPRWHAQWPDIHCTPTKCEAHKNGRIFATVKKSGCPWGNYKGTWELPAKIDRRTAEEISHSTEYKKDFWDTHRRKHLLIYQRIHRDKHNKKEQPKEKEISNEEIKEEIEIIEEAKGIAEEKEKIDMPKPNNGQNLSAEGDCKVEEACLI